MICFVEGVKRRRDHLNAYLYVIGSDDRCSCNRAPFGLKNEGGVISISLGNMYSRYIMVMLPRFSLGYHTNITL